MTHRTLPFAPCGGRIGGFKIKDEIMKKIKLYIDIFISFLKISAFTFGGGPAMLPILKSELVDKHNWMTEDEMIDLFASAQIIPGVIFINVACLIGIRVAGIFGAVIASIAVLLPVLVCIGIFIFFFNYINKDILNKIFKGIISGVVAITFVVAIELFKKYIKSFMTFMAFIISFILIDIVKVKIYYVLLLGIVVGLIYYFMTARGKEQGHA